MAPRCGCGEPLSSPRYKQCVKCYRLRGSDGATLKPTECKDCKKVLTRKTATRCRACYTKSVEKSAIDKAVKPGDDSNRDRLVERIRGEAKRYRKAYSATVKEAVEEERLLGLFESSLERFPKLPPYVFKPAAKGPTDIHRHHKEVPVLLLGDQHIGEVASIDETFGVNEYNFGVYQRRLEHLEDRLVDILTNHQKAPFSELVVFSIGDNVSGVIHEELQKFGHQNIVDQAFLGALTTALFLYRLLVRLRPRGIRKIRVSCVSGNHGRLSKQKESKQYFKNWDYLFHSIVAQALGNVKEIEFHIPKCLFTVVDVANSRILQSHGHELPPSSLGIPLYSINRASASYQELLSWTEAERYDYWVLGHFHRPLEMDNCIVNGTMAGLTEFGIGKFKPTRPMQKLLGFHEKWGLAWQYPIRLDKAPASKVYKFEMDMATTDALDALEQQMNEA